MNRIQIQNVCKSIQRGIDTVLSGKDANNRAKEALRSFCYAVTKERGRDWLDIGYELVAERLTKEALEGSERESNLAKMNALAETRTDTEALRAFLLEWINTCDTFNVCFMAAGFKAMQEQYRSDEQGNVASAMQRIIESN